VSKELSWANGTLFDVFDAWHEAARFCADVHHVITLRTIRLASGGPLAATEAWQMVSEKVSAFEEAQAAIVSALTVGGSFNATRDAAYAPYRRCVRANRDRLDS